MAASNVIDLEQKRLESKPHACGEAVCLACDHKWVAVTPINSEGVMDDLECPSCHLERGVFSRNMEPDGPIWVCNCGCIHNVVFPGGVMCSYCGVATPLSELF